MDFDALTIFRVVAAERSITRAASRLGRVPSNVTTRIQQLEAELGVDLFIRSGKRLALSSAGQQYLGYAERLLQLADEALHVVSGSPQGGTLRIGSMEATAASRLPAVLADYGMTYPDARVEIDTAPSRQLMQKLVSGQVDCAFLALPAEDDDTVADLAAYGLAGVPVWRESMVMLTPTRDQHARTAKDIRTRALAAFPSGCAYRAMAETTLSMAHAVDWRVQEIHSYHGMIASVAAGHSVALLPESVAALAPLPSGLGAFDVGEKQTWLVRRGDYDAPLFRHFRDRVQIASGCGA